MHTWIIKDNLPNDLPWNLKLTDSATPLFRLVALESLISIINFFYLLLLLMNFVATKVENVVNLNEQNWFYFATVMFVSLPTLFVLSLFGLNIATYY